MHTATNVVFNSRSLRAAAEADGLIRSGRGVVLASGSGNGLDFARFESAPDRSSARSRIGLDADDRVLGFVGRYTRDKGIEDLLEAFSIISESIPGVRLVLAGRQDESDPISADCLRRIADTELITDLGWIDEPIELLAAIDVLVFPSYREGLPNVPLEAQALGVPVVAYGATGTVDAVIDGETGILVSVGSIVGLADGVAELVSDRSRMVEMGERGREWVRGEFAPERIWDELLLNYEFWID
jgi:glycosyltransferase involved in cell wall biosynthesis